MIKMASCLTLCLLLLPTVLEAKDWNITSKLEPIQKSQILRHRLNFFPQGKKTPSYTYVPESPPYGMVDEKKIIIQGGVYFLTEWAHGAHTVIFRVFNPNRMGSNVVCEEISIAEESDLRINKKQLQIQIVKDEESLPKWLKCGKKMIK